jgi:hypothetical protein
MLKFPLLSGDTQVTSLPLPVMVPSLADQLNVIGSSSGSAATAVIIVLSPEITSAGLAAILEIAGDWFGTGAGGGTGGGAGAAQALPKMAARANTATTVTRLPLEILILNTPPFYLNYTPHLLLFPSFYNGDEPGKV